VQDWDAAVETAARHRVAAFVLEAATRHGVYLPDEIRSAFHARALAAMAQVMLLDAQLRRVLDAFARVNVPAIVLKGPALTRALYPAAVLRPYGDLDLTVQHEHEAAAVEALTELGFREMPNEPDQAREAGDWHAHEHAGFHRLFAGADGRTLVELHLDPLQLGLRPTDEAARWRRAVPVPQLPGALMLCPEDQVVQLSVHAHKHGFDRLIWLKDLDLLLRSQAATLNWRLVTRVARAEGVSGSVWYGLLLCARLLGTPLPHEPLARLRPAAPIRLLYQIAWPFPEIAALGGQMRRRAVQFDARDSWRGMLPGLVLMGRRRDRIRAVVRFLLHRLRAAWRDSKRRP
jgi:hypothetical protein